MLVIIGAVLVVASVFGGYVALGGHTAVLFQPFELVIIGGAALGAGTTSLTRLPARSGTGTSAAFRSAP